MARALVTSFLVAADVITATIRSQTLVNIWITKGTDHPSDITVIGRN